MHRALTIPDIANEILEHLLPFRLADIHNEALEYMLFRPEVRQDLRAVALTCRLLSELALNILWANMDGLLPLFYILPSFNFGEDEPGTIEGPISDHALERFQSHANRIRSLRHVDIEQIGSSCYTQVSQRSGRPCILPNLRYLLIQSITAPDVPQLTLLLPSRLEGFSMVLRPFHIEETRRAATTLLGDVLQHSFRLTSLRLVCFLPQQTFGAILRLPELEKLSILHTSTSRPLLIPTNLFFVMEPKATLSDLSIRGDIAIAPSEDTVPFSVSTFPALTHLKLYIHFDTFSLAADLFSSSYLPQLKSLSMFFIGLPDRTIPVEKSWSEWCDSLSNCLSSTLLRMDLQLMGCVYDLRIPIHSLVRALPTRLDWFECLGSLFSPLTPLNFLEFIRSQNALTSLLLEASGQIVMGFDTLQDIARELPDLAQLSMELDLRQLPSIDEIPILRHKLVRIDLSKSRLTNPRVLARSLDRLFPNLRHFDFDAVHEEDGPAAFQVWDQAREFLQDLQRARRDQVIRQNIRNTTS